MIDFRETKIMKRFLVFIGAFLLLWSGPAFAVPMLQLDIENGKYDPLTETMIATDPVFNLIAPPVLG